MTKLKLRNYGGELGSKMIFPPTVCTSGKQGVSTSEETLNVKGLEIRMRR